MFISKNAILQPALNDAKSNMYVTQDEYVVLKQVIASSDQLIQAKDLKSSFKDKFLPIK